MKTNRELLFCPSILIMLVAVLLTASVAAAETSASSSGKTHRVDRTLPADQGVELRLAMRKLWEDHITYTRNYIISDLAELPDRDAIAVRLLKNQDDIGAAIRPYYGEAAAAKLSGLLREHITVATEVVKAAKLGNKQELAIAQKKWTANGRSIAMFLSGANPHWSKKTLGDMLQMHLDLTTEEVVARLKKDWEADIEAYDKGHLHMLMFADLLSEGIVKQFPEKVIATRSGT